MKWDLKKILCAVTMVAAMVMTKNVMAATPADFTVNPNIWVASPPVVVGNTDTVEIIVGTTPDSFAGVSAVTFGGTNATSFLLVDNTHLSVVPPLLSKGAVDIVVTTITAGPVTTNFLLAKGFVYTRANRTLQVTVNMKLGADASLAWGAATGSDDSIAANGGGAPHANTITPFVWWVRDSEFGLNPARIDLAATYSTDGAAVAFPTADPDNAHAITITSASKTSSAVRIDAIVSDDAPSSGLPWAAGVATNPFWKAGVAAGLDQFLMQADITVVGASVSTGIQPLANTAPVTLLTTAAIPTTLDSPLFLQISTPSTTAATPPAITATLHTVTVSLIGTGL